MTNDNTPVSLMSVFFFVFNLLGFIWPQFQFTYIILFIGTLLTTTVFLHCINAKKYHKEIIKNLNTLIDIDKLRAGYYNDMIAKWSIEEQLVTDYMDNKDGSFKIKFPEQISSLPHIQYYSYCKVADLSNQNLVSKSLPSLVMLQHCKVSRNFAFIKYETKSHFTFFTKLHLFEVKTLAC